MFNVGLGRYPKQGRRVRLTLAAALIALAGAEATAAGDAAAGKIKFETCRGCHAIEGYNNTYPTYPVPRLKGQKVDYIVAALKGYQSGERAHPTMQGQAKSMTEQDMQDIAAYIGSLSD